jgi:hypothetical protein
MIHPTHDMRDIPDLLGYHAKLGALPSGPKPMRACFKCGMFDTNMSHCTECDICKVAPHMNWYQAGGHLDPFASMRTNTAGMGISAGAVHPRNTATTGPNGMPIRRPPDPAPPSVANPAETRPGLAPEAIDKKAYDEFMRGL